MKTHVWCSHPGLKRAWRIFWSSGEGFEGPQNEKVFSWTWRHANSCEHLRSLKIPALLESFPSGRSGPHDIHMAVTSSSLKWQTERFHAIEDPPVSRRNLGPESWKRATTKEVWEVWRPSAMKHVEHLRIGAQPISFLCSWYDKLREKYHTQICRD